MTMTCAFGHKWTAWRGPFAAVATTRTHRGEGEQFVRGEDRTCKRCGKYEIRRWLPPEPEKGKSCLFGLHSWSKWDAPHEGVRTITRTYTRESVSFPVTIQSRHCARCDAVKSRQVVPAHG